MIGYFDEEAFDAALTDSDVQNMARRQLSVSLAVAFALLTLAGVTVLSGSPKSSFEVAARQHGVVRAEASRLEVAQPALRAPSRS